MFNKSPILAHLPIHSLFVEIHKLKVAELKSLCLPQNRRTPVSFEGWLLHLWSGIRPCALLRDFASAITYSPSIILNFSLSLAFISISEQIRTNDIHVKNCPWTPGPILGPASLLGFPSLGNLWNDGYDSSFPLLHLSLLLKPVHSHFCPLHCTLTKTTNTKARYHSLLSSCWTPGSICYGSLPLLLERLSFLSLQDTTLALTSYLTASVLCFSDGSCSSLLSQGWWAPGLCS